MPMLVVSISSRAELSLKTIVALIIYCQAQVQVPGQVQVRYEKVQGLRTKDLDLS